MKGSFWHKASLNLSIPALSLCIITMLASLGTLAAHKPARNKLQQAVMRLTTARRQQILLSELYTKYYIHSNNDDALQDDLDSMEDNGSTNIPALESFIKMLISKRQGDFSRAHRYAKETRTLANEKDDQHLIYHTHMLEGNLFYQENENPEAIYHYRQAQAQAEGLENKSYLTLTDLGLAELYLKLQNFDQTLLYCKMAELSIENQNKSSLNILARIRILKAQTFFNLQQPDSLRHYIEETAKVAKYLSKPQIDMQELASLKLVMQREYPQAIIQIKGLLKVSDNPWKPVNISNLAQCYFAIHDYKSAARVTKKIINDSAMPEPVKLRATMLRAQIAIIQHDPTQAIKHLQQSIDRYDDLLKDMSQIGEISSSIKFDRLTSASRLRQRSDRNKIILLVFGLTITILVMIIMFLFNRNFKQRRNFEMELAETKNKDMAFINSHEVRRHLANILGICMILNIDNVSTSEKETFVHDLNTSARQLDTCLTTLAEKINDSLS